MRFSFPVTTLLDRIELKALYQDGLLDWPRYFTMSMNALGLAYDTIPEEPKKEEPEPEKEKEEEELD